ncbi:MAG: helix-turn-helix domain-containing protein, partial [Lachnospiraceae bacterium]|nr:helix-turn-helix domain-containing protein [Lachnospiraceae bacterium]
MFEIDKKEFGIFVAELRKEKGLKQKELAAKLLISDKAVSKWETGLSMPDITLLVPLADILDVTVTELLECRRMTAETMTAVQTEALVKKTISMSEAELTTSAKSKRRWGAAYACCITVSCIEILLYFLLEYSMELFFTHLLTIEILVAVFV